MAMPSEMASIANVSLGGPEPPGPTLTRRKERRFEFTAQPGERGTCLASSPPVAGINYAKPCHLVLGALSGLQTRLGPSRVHIGSLITLWSNKAFRVWTSHPPSPKKGTHSELIRAWRGLKCLSFMVAILLFLITHPASCEAVEKKLHDFSLESTTLPKSQRGPVNLAEPLHGDDVDFVRARVEAAIASGTSLSQLPAVAAEAAHEVSWGECSKLCGGGIQTADRVRARSIAMAGIRRALSAHKELSDADVEAAGNLAANLGLDSDEVNAKAKARECNTFRCPPEVPFNLKSAVKLSLSTPTFVASLGFLMGIELSEACKNRLKLDEIGQNDWIRRRKHHAEALREQAGGEKAGWEATVLSSEDLTLHSCVSLCRLYRRCGAVMYVENYPPTRGEGEGAKNTEQLESLTDDRLAGQPVDGIATEESATPLESSKSHPLLREGPMCTLYPHLKASLIEGCAVEPSEGSDNRSVHILVLDPNLEYSRTAQNLRAAMKLASEKEDAGLEHDAEGVTAAKGQQSTTPGKPNTQVAKRASEYVQALSHALRVFEDAAIQDSRALEAARSAEGFGISVFKPAAVKENPGELLLHATQPLSESCQIFEGVELLGRGCVQRPALQIVPRPEDSNTANADTANPLRTVDEVHGMTWQRCHGLLQRSAQILAEYRDALKRNQTDRAKVEGEDVSENVKKFLQELLGLDDTEAALLARGELGASADDTSFGVDNTILYRKLDALKERVGVAEELGGNNGNMFAIFDTVEKACEIRAVFERRVSQRRDTLGSQFPSACGLIRSSAILILPSEEKSSTEEGTAAATDQSTNSVDACPEVSCVYSPWTSWSPCSVAVEGGDGRDKETSRKDEEISGKGVPHKMHREQTRWQVRLKEALVRPKLLSVCKALVEARYCSDNVTDETEQDQVHGLAATVARNTSTWCEYSPFSAWSTCEPACRRDVTEDTVAYRTRSRYVQQYAVPGIAPSCDPESLVESEKCDDLPQCLDEQLADEGSGEQTDDSIFVEGQAVKTSADSGFLKHSPAGSQEKYVHGSKHEYLRKYGGYSSGAGVSTGSAPTSTSYHVEGTKRTLISSSDKHKVVGHHRSKQNEAFRHVGFTTDFIGHKHAHEHPSHSPKQRTEYNDVAFGNVGHPQRSAEPSFPQVDDGKRDASSVGGNPTTLPFDWPSTEDTGVGASGDRLKNGIEGAGNPTFLEDKPTALPFDSPLTENTGTGYPTAGDTSSRPSQEMPTDEGAGGGRADSSSVGENSTIPPYDAHTSEQIGSGASGSGTNEGSNGGDTTASSASQSGSQDFLFGISLASFVACCLCGAFACATVVLLAIVCSKRIRFRLGHDWSGATEEERQALITQGGSVPPVELVPLVDPSGNPVKNAEGAPVLVSPCLETSGTQYVTTGGSKVFLTQDGGFVDDWGRPIQNSDLPQELKAKAGTTPVQSSSASSELSIHVPGGRSMAKTPHPNAAPSPQPDIPRAPIAKAIGQSGGRTLGDSSTTGSSNKTLTVPQTQGGTVTPKSMPKKTAPLPKQPNPGTVAPGSPLAKAPKPGFPTTKSPGA